MEENKIEKDIKQIENFNYNFLNATRLKLDFPVNMNISDDTHDAIMDILTDYKRLKEEFKQIDHECSRLEQKEIKLQKENEELKRFTSDIFNENEYVYYMHKDGAISTCPEIEIK